MASSLSGRHSREHSNFPNHMIDSSRAARTRSAALRADEELVRRIPVVRRNDSIVHVEPGALPAHAPADEDQDGSGESSLPRVVENRLEAVWKAFKAVRQPTAAQMNEFLTALLSLPPEATQWSDVLHQFARRKPPDLHAVFRRIAAAVPTPRIPPSPSFTGRRRNSPQHVHSDLSIACRHRASFRTTRRGVAGSRRACLGARYRRNNARRGYRACRQGHLRARALLRVDASNVELATSNASHGNVEKSYTFWIRALAGCATCSFHSSVIVWLDSCAL